MVNAAKKHTQIRNAELDLALQLHLLSLLQDALNVSKYMAKSHKPLALTNIATCRVFHFRLQDFS